MVNDNRANPSERTPAGERGAGEPTCPICGHSLDRPDAYRGCDHTALLTELDREVMEEMAAKADKWSDGGPVFQAIARDYRWALATIAALRGADAAPPKCYRCEMLEEEVRDLRHGFEEGEDKELAGALQVALHDFPTRCSVKSTDFHNRLLVALLRERVRVVRERADAAPARRPPSDVREAAQEMLDALDALDAGEDEATYRAINARDALRAALAAPGHPASAERLRDARTPLRGDRWDAYMLAPSGEGPLASEWVDKPHRLVYDLVAALRGGLPPTERSEDK